MNKIFSAGNFKLTKSELYYKDKLFLADCDEIINLALSLGLNDYSGLEELDIDESEIEWLESMLNKAIFGSTSICLKK